MEHSSKKTRGGARPNTGPKPKLNSKPRKYLTIKCDCDVFVEFKKRVLEVRKELES